MSLPDPSARAPRLLAGVPLPATRYVPGEAPHPLRDAGGHALPTLPPAVPEWGWRGEPAYLYGLDLLNAGYPWEAHEVWEGRWRTLPTDDPLRWHLQGLIQLAAARLRAHKGDPASAQRLAASAARRFGAVREAVGPVAFGLPVAALLDALRGEAWPRLIPVIRVVAAAVVHEGRVLAALRPAHASRGGLWELPGGKVERGEDDAAALSRELVEELGIAVTVGALLGEVVHDYGDVCVHLVGWAATWVEGTPTPIAHDALRWLSPDELGDLTWAPADVPLLDAVRALLEGRGARRG